MLDVNNNSLNPAKIILKSSSWQDFKKILSSKSRKEKGDAFELLVKLYLQTNPKYNLLFSDVWLLCEMPSKLLKKLNQPTSDEGADLYAKTKNGDYWSIQAKYKSDPTSTVSRKDLATFTDISFVKTNKISFGLICQSTNQFTKKFAGYKQLGFLTNEVWTELSEVDFKAFKNLIRTPNKQISIKPFNPRNHQERAIQNARNHFFNKNSTRGKLIMPCGAGKSLIGYWISRDFEARLIIVCVPSLNLIKQTLDSWCRESYANKIEIDWICVCSDASVGKLDDNVVYTQNLGIQVNTSVDKIAEFLKKRDKRIKVVFTTYQSGKVIATASQKSKIAFELGIFDEAHKTVGTKDKLFSHLLFEKNIKIKKRVFMTATEKRYRGNSEQILSMDNPEMYGDTFELLTFKNAIELKKPILSDYKIVTVCIDDSEYKEFIKNNSYVRPKKGQWDDEMEMKSLTSLIALRKAINKYNIKHAITFHNSIAKAKAFQESNEIINKNYPQFKSVDTFHVTGKTNTSIRSRILKDFSLSKRAIITNARCLTEGIDVKNVDCVLFADPKKSTVDIVQAVGRALRLSEEKKIGYVIIPVQTSSEEGLLEIKEDSYDTLVNVLRALASNDERIVEYFKDKSEGRKTQGKKIEIDIDAKIAKKVSIRNFEKELSLTVWDKLGKLRWMDFEDARKFVRELRLVSLNEWQKYCRNEFSDLPKKPISIPNRPASLYKGKGWVSVGDWLGTGRVANFNKQFLSFEEARDFVRKLGLKNSKQWSEYCKGKLKMKKPDDIPSGPSGTYNGKGWISMGDWLGTDYVANSKRNYLSFQKAREIVHKMGVNSAKEWRAISKKKLIPKNIPSEPRTVYKNEWQGWGDWLGTFRIAEQKRIFLSYEESKKFVRKLKLKGIKEWRKYCNNEYENLPPKPDNIPSNPQVGYKHEFISVGDWLGTGSISNRQRKFLPFNKAKKYVHTLKLKSNKEWRKYCSEGIKDKSALPNNVPTNPQRTYKDEWLGWGDWLGTGNKYKRNWLSYNSARAIIVNLKLKSHSDWKRYLKSDNKPENIPSAPDVVYKGKGWHSWKEWLGRDS